MTTARLYFVVGFCAASGVTAALAEERDDLNGVWFFTGSETPTEARSKRAETQPAASPGF